MKEKAANDEKRKAKFLLDLTKLMSIAIIQIFKINNKFFVLKNS